MASCLRKESPFIVSGFVSPHPRRWSLALEEHVSTRPQRAPPQGHLLSILFSSMKSYKSSSNTSAAAIPRPFSPRVIIIAVKTIIHRVSSKTRRKSSRQVAIPQGHNDECAPPLNAEAGRVDRKVSIEILPDEVLLEIFNHDRLFALNHPLLGPWKWQRLVHVCRSWRFLIFASPRHLELRLYYTYRKPVTQNLGCWPPFPIAIWYPRFASSRLLIPKDEDNVVAALMHRHRICEINFAMTSHLLERSRIMMQEPFPALEHLLLRSRDPARRSLVLPPPFIYAGPALSSARGDPTYRILFTGDARQ
ncbi:hypothetical protein BC827DRAFT_108901 [Russula dissimulans]|nr:hypothetical protein BC827DRAFT_108901 [Russula dissimulans]